MEMTEHYSHIDGHDLDKVLEVIGEILRLSSIYEFYFNVPVFLRLLLLMVHTTINDTIMVSDGETRVDSIMYSPVRPVRCCQYRNTNRCKSIMYGLSSGS